MAKRREPDPSKILKFINNLFLIAFLVGLCDLIFLQNSPFKIRNGSTIGILIFIIGVLLYQNAKSTLGDQFSNLLTMVDNPRLVTHGIYSYIRHPYYMGGILIGVGSQLAFGSLLGLALMSLPILLTIWIVPFEENMLIEKFGVEYVNYVKRTKKLIPFIY